MPLRIQGEMSKWSVAPILNVGETSCAGHLTERRAGSRERRNQAQVRQVIRSSRAPALSGRLLRLWERFSEPETLGNIAFDAVSLGGV